MRNCWTKEEDQIIIDNFGKIKLSEIVKLLPNRNYNGVKGRQTFLKIVPKPDFHKKEDFFEIPNTLNSSIAGFIASDGHLSLPNQKKDGRWNKCYRIDFGINQKDIKLLEDINYFTNSNYKISISSKPRIFDDKKTGKKYNYIDNKASLYISQSEKWHQDLSLTRQKTHLLSADGMNGEI